MPEFVELVDDSLRQSKNLQHSMDKIAHELRSITMRSGAVPLSLRNWRDAADKRTALLLNKSSRLGNDAKLLDYRCCWCEGMACWLAKNALN
ncbi:hypothetical protein ACNKHS_23040 [Shigella flexneri]